MFDPLANFKLNKIKKGVEALPETLSSSFTDVKNAISGVSTKADTLQSTVNTIKNTVNTIKTTVSKGSVVGIQQGEGTYSVTFPANDYDKNDQILSIPISSVNINKAYILSYEFKAKGQYAEHMTINRPVLNANNIKVAVSTSATFTSSVKINIDGFWRVIEFT